MRPHARPVAGLALALAVTAVAGAAQSAPLMIVGLDEKLTWDEAGQPVVSPTGRDSILIVDLARPERPMIVGKLALENSVMGPPVNVIISPDGALALVADSHTAVSTGTRLRLASADKVFVIDLKAKPPRLAQTLTVGAQPSGLSFNATGDLALVAYRASSAIGVLKVEHGRVREIGRVDVGDSVSHVAFTGDGRRALAIKHDVDKVALLHVDGDKVIYDKVDLPTGKAPYNIAIAPRGHMAAVTNTRTLTLLDLRSDPPQVQGEIPVPPGVEGLAFSPSGNLAIAVSIDGSNGPHDAAGYHRNGRVTVLRVDGSTLTQVKQVEVGSVPEAIGFTPDGRYVYVGNFADQDFSILRVRGTEVTDTGARFETPGHPASARTVSR